MEDTYVTSCHVVLLVQFMLTSPGGEPSVCGSLLDSSLKSYKNIKICQVY